MSSVRGRGRGGRTVVQQPRSSRRNASNRGKKRCERGMSCPYLHEHQHQSEFFHDDGGPSVNNENGRSSTNAYPSENRVFQGPGHRLGGSMTLVHPRLQREARLAAIEARLQTTVESHDCPEGDEDVIVVDDAKRIKTQERTPIDLT